VGVCIYLALSLFLFFRYSFVVCETEFGGLIIGKLTPSLWAALMAKKNKTGIIFSARRWAGAARGDSRDRSKGRPHEMGERPDQTLVFRFPNRFLISNQGRARTHGICFFSQKDLIFWMGQVLYYKKKGG
jgi:hypothetical protein